MEKNLNPIEVSTFWFMVCIPAVLFMNCSQSTDLILFNASVFDGENFTGDELSIVVDGGSFSFIGDSTSAAERAGNQTERVDLAGKFLMPGLFDAHVHPIGGAEERRVVQLSGLKTVEEIGDAILIYAAQNPELEIIRGRGWELSVFPGGNPSKKILDEWVPYKPDEALNLTAILAACTSGNARLRAWKMKPEEFLRDFQQIL
jgi:predicted amidohydrolase YtcJ